MWFPYLGPTYQKHFLGDSGSHKKPQELEKWEKVEREKGLKREEEEIE